VSHLASELLKVVSLMYCFLFVLTVLSYRFDLCFISEYLFLGRVFQFVWSSENCGV
jgi:hypothetical protein